VFRGSRRLSVYGKGFSKIVGVEGGCNSRADEDVSIDEIREDGDSTKLADVRVCAITSSSDLGGNESGDGAGG